MTTPAPAAPRNAALDGLRALAVSAVVLFHAGVGAVGGGFLGVDLFFVLSGYLITGLLLAEHASHGRISLTAFWARRARRLLPALLVMVLVVVPLAARGGDNGLRADALATLGYVANWHLVALGGGYFAQQADPSPLQHTWSLAIEEQFYLLWPLLVLVCLRLTRGRGWLLGAALALGVASAVGTAVLAAQGGNLGALYYRTDTRAQALLLGAVVAVLLHRGLRLRLPQLIGAVGLTGLLVLWCVAEGSATTLYEAGLPAAALGSALVVASVASHPASGLSRALGVLPLRSLGRVSYGVYLWHWPVDLGLTASRTGVHGVALLGARVATTLALAVLSWYTVERPAHRLARVPVLVLPAALAGGLAAALVVAAVTEPRVAPPPAQAVAAVVPTAESSPYSPSPASAPTPPPTTIPAPVSTRPVPAAPAATPTPQAEPAARPTGPPLQVTVLGDSVADSLGSGLTGIDDRYNAVVRNRGIVGCGVAATPRYRFRDTVYDLADACRDWERTWAADIARDHPQVALVVLGRHEVWDGELSGRWTHVGEADFDSYLAAQLDRAIAIAAGQGARVALATSPYFQGRERPDGGEYVENNPARVDRFNALVRAAVARHSSQAFLVDLGHAACPDGHYTSTVGGVRIRQDGVHFTAAGARYLAPWLFEALRR